jgi:hypothetical protein
MTITDLMAVLSAYLISGGTLGFRQNQILHRFKYLPKEDVLMALEVLWEEEKVQRFTMPNKTIVWRATEKINV